MKSYEDMDSGSHHMLDSVKPPKVANLASSIEFNQALLHMENDAASRVYRATSFAADSDYNEKLMRDSFEIHRAKLKNNPKESGGSQDLLSKSIEDRRM